MTKSLAGKVALVTGASRGLGRATALNLAADGALVAINYATNDRAAEETRAAIETAGGQAFLVKGAVGSHEAAVDLEAKLSKELVARTGSAEIDILINNAGGGPVHTVETTTSDVFDRVMGDNFSGAFFTTQLLLPRLRNNARVIFVSSLGAKLALPQYVIYACAKSAVETLTVVLAKDLGPRGITVNCIMPGLITSDSNSDIRADEALTAQFVANIPLGGFGEPEDYAGLVSSLVSDKMRYVTGQVIAIAGGMGL